MLFSVWPAALLLAVLTPVASADTRLNRAEDTAKVLQKFYNTNAGLWSTASWWQGANALQTLADLEEYSKAGLTNDVWTTTFANAPAHGGKNFLNNYYDDEGWWALAWIRVYDLTGKKEYLSAATALFNDMLGTGGNATCGGIWWKKSAPRYMTSIANELFISVAAHLANRVANGAYYHGWAEKTWTWFATSGLINANNLVRDGLDDQCKPRGGLWTYNQGVILGALLEMHKFEADDNLISRANDIASAAMAIMVDQNGILHESSDNNTAKYPYPVGHDGQTFKGVFMRNLARLQLYTNRADQKLFITRNADSIWDKARYANGSIGINWAGPLNNAADAPQQAAGLDALVAAYAVAKTDAPLSSAQAGVKASTKFESSTHTTKKTTEAAVKSTTKTSAKATAQSTAKASPVLEGSTKVGFDGLKLVICPVGDSITVGFHSSDGNGYRGPLRQMLEQAGASVKMVGTQHNGNMVEPYHEGWSGSGIPGIRGNVTKDGALAKYKPNVVLLHAGTNDMVPGHDPVYDPGQAHVWLQSFMEYIYQQVPGVTILVAQIIEPLNDPGRLERTTSYNAEVAALVKKMAAAGSKIFLANSGPWLTTQNTTMYSDHLHPNTNGYKVLAQGWFKGLTNLIESHRSWVDPSLLGQNASNDDQKPTSKSSKAALLTGTTTSKSKTSAQLTLKTSYTTKVSSSHKVSSSPKTSPSHKMSPSSKVTVSHAPSHSSQTSKSHKPSSSLLLSNIHKSSLSLKPSSSPRVSSSNIHKLSTSLKPSSSPRVSLSNIHKSSLSLIIPSSPVRISSPRSLTDPHTTMVVHTVSNSYGLPTTHEPPSITKASSRAKSATQGTKSTRTSKQLSSPVTAEDYSSTRAKATLPSYVVPRPTEAPLPTHSHPQYSFTRPVGFPVYYHGYGIWRRWLGGEEGPMAVDEQI